MVSKNHKASHVSGRQVGVGLFVTERAKETMREK